MEVLSGRACGGAGLGVLVSLPAVYGSKSSLHSRPAVAESNAIEPLAVSSN